MSVRSSMRSNAPEASGRTRRNGEPSPTPQAVATKIPDAEFVAVSQDAKPSVHALGVSTRRRMWTVWPAKSPARRSGTCHESVTAFPLTEGRGSSCAVLTGVWPTSAESM